MSTFLHNDDTATDSTADYDNTSTFSSKTAELKVLFTLNAFVITKTPQKAKVFKQNVQGSIS